MVLRKLDSYMQKNLQLFDIDLINIFLGLSSQARVTNTNINEWDYIKLRIFCTEKETINKMERPPTVWEKIFAMIYLSSVQSLSRVRLFATPWITARQASLSITNSQSLLKLMSIESVMPSNNLILCRPLLLRLQSFPTSGSFQMSQLFASGGQSTGVSALTSVLPMNIQDWSPLGWTSWISL